MSSSVDVAFRLSLLAFVSQEAKACVDKLKKKRGFKKYPRGFHFGKMKLGLIDWLTLKQSIKMWWSYTWRVMVLGLPVMVVIMSIAFFTAPFPKPGQPPQPLPPSEAPMMILKMFVLWVSMMAGFAIAQASAMRWMLKTKWSDFRISVVKVPRE